MFQQKDLQLCQNTTPNSNWSTDWLPTRTALISVCRSPNCSLQSGETTHRGLCKDQSLLLLQGAPPKTTMVWSIKTGSIRQMASTTQLERTLRAVKAVHSFRRTNLWLNSSTKKTLPRFLSLKTYPFATQWQQVWPQPRSAHQPKPFMQRPKGAQCKRILLSPW